MSVALRVDELSIQFGGVAAVRGVSFSVKRGQILAIIGPNGAGKTTLFNMISGLYRPSSGRVHLKDEDVTGFPPYKLARAGVSRTFQNLQVFMGQTVLENVMIGRCRWEDTSLIADLLHLPSVRRQNSISEEHAWAALRQVKMEQYAHTMASNLSYGSLKRLELARALASEPDVLLLDEPAAGCNAVETAEIEEIVKGIAASKEAIAIVLIEHDMKMVMRLSDNVLVLNQGQILAYGPPDAVRHNAAVIEAYLGTHAKEVEHAQN
ncbi:MAG: ABC transporter ATP-binding protein [Achromobacter sp.]|uniref:ABC transporter ATP-binding protein n=1 Tax=Achromobacter sp. TaxID=134375 RepID=UPI0012C17D9D|nr:ABC transporter ATP-binding protein [Achromobacter sp.]MPS79704.1 ABC transporter ATP-binding protein [Achromobacter sp.]